MMPKKKRKETSEQQAERFRKTVRDRIAAGELNPTEADEAFERAMAGVVKLREGWFDAESD